MKKTILLVAALVLVALVVRMALRRTAPPVAPDTAQQTTDPASPGRETPPPQPGAPASPQPPGVATRAALSQLPPAAAGAPAPQPPPRPMPRGPVDPEAHEDVENVRLMLRDFRTVEGENPTGTNAEIMKAVMGGNKKQARLGPPTGQNLNGEGELVDRWGTPIFFHQVSATEMEIRSAGPDKTLFTGDDVVTK